jgi:hypothetical protein
MNPLFGAIAVASTVALVGCATQRPLTSTEEMNRRDEAQYYWGRNTYLAMNGPRGAMPAASIWSGDANNESKSRDERCLGAAMLFGGYVRPGFTTDDMRVAMPDPRWLRSCRFKSS